MSNWTLLPIAERSPTYPADQKLRNTNHQILFHDGIGRLLTASSDAPSEQVDSAADKEYTIVYLDAGTCLERINTVTVSSASLGLSYTDTYTYQQTNGEYQLTNVARS